MANRDPYEPEYPTGAAAGMARERSTADIVKDAVANLQELVRAEMRLAKAELREEAAKAGKGAGMMAGGIVLALYGAGFILACVAWLLGTVMAPWLAALIVGAVLVIAGAIVMSAGRSRLKQVRPVPDRTIQSVKEDVEWLKRQTR